MPTCCCYYLHSRLKEWHHDKSDQTNKSNAWASRGKDVIIDCAYQESFVCRSHPTKSQWSSISLHKLWQARSPSPPCQRARPPKVWNCIFCELTMKAYFLDIDEVAHSDRRLSYRVRGVVPSSLSWNPPFWTRCTPISTHRLCVESTTDQEVEQPIVDWLGGKCTLGWSAPWHHHHSYS